MSSDLKRLGETVRKVNESNESNQSKICRLELRDGAEKLVRAATKNKACIVGFIFGMEPQIFIRFGNVTESGPDLAELYIRLTDMAEDKEMSGQVIKDRIEP